MDILYSPYITPKKDIPGYEINLRLSQTDLFQKFGPFLDYINNHTSVSKYRNYPSENTVCYAGRDQISIRSNGLVYPCLNLRLRLGNIKTESLSDILSRRKSIMSSFSIDNMAKCLDCPVVNFCNSCIGIALIENKDYKIPSPHKCDISQFYYKRGVENESV